MFVIIICYLAAVSVLSFLWHLRKLISLLTSLVFYFVIYLAICHVICHVIFCCLFCYLFCYYYYFVYLVVCFVEYIVILCALTSEKADLLLFPKLLKGVCMHPLPVTDVSFWILFTMILDNLIYTVHTLKRVAFFVSYRFFCCIEIGKSKQGYSFYCKTC